MTRSAKIILIALSIVTLVVGVICVREITLQSAYSHVENLTKQYGSAMQPVIMKEVEGKKEEGKMVIETRLEYIKVFDVISSTAKVFVVVNSTFTHSYGYVDKDRTGSFRYLRQQDGNWIIDTAKSEEVVWDRDGVADGMTWPPYN